MGEALPDRAGCRVRGRRRHPGCGRRRRAARPGAGRRVVRRWGIRGHPQRHGPWRVPRAARRVRLPWHRAGIVHRVQAHARADDRVRAQWVGEVVVLGGDGDRAHGCSPSVEQAEFPVRARTPQSPCRRSLPRAARPDPPGRGHIAHRGRVEARCPARGVPPHAGTRGSAARGRHRLTRLGRGAGDLSAAAVL